MRTFHRLVANTLIASVTNNFLWFALTFWVYLETRSVIASSVIGGAYMLLLAASALAFGTFVDRHRRKASMLVSSVGSLGAYLAATLLYALAPSDSLQHLDRPSFWAFITLVLAGAIAGNLRTVALSTTVTLLVPVDRHDKANGLIGTVTGIGFALTSVFSGLAIGMLGMGWSLLISIALTAVATVHLLGIGVQEDAPAPPGEGEAPRVDLTGALRAVRAIDGLLVLLLFTTFNNFVLGAFMALMDPYGLMLVSVETWGLLWAFVSFGFILGGAIVARRGLGANPVRTLLLTNVALWVICVLFPARSWILLVAAGMFVFMVLIPVVEASEQTIIQRVVPFEEQGRVFGFAQSVETAASPVTSFLLGPITQVWVIPFMTTGAGAEAIGGWFGTGADRAIALVFMVSGLLGLGATLLALRSRAAADLSARYARAAATPGPPHERGSAA
jgi:DHA3 family multidrug efflux protein-like MFS transporter